jgi:hypothetical protein
MARGGSRVVGDRSGGARAEEGATDRGVEAGQADEVSGEGQGVGGPGEVDAGDGRGDRPDRPRHPGKLRAELLYQQKPRPVPEAQRVRIDMGALDSHLQRTNRPSPIGRRGLDRGSMPAVGCRRAASMDEDDISGCRPCREGHSKLVRHPWM